MMVQLSPSALSGAVFCSVTGVTRDALAGWPVLRTLAAHLNRWLGAEDTADQTPRFAVSACQRGTDVVRSKEGGPSLLMNESLPPRWAGIASKCSLGRGRVIPPLGELRAFLNHEMKQKAVT